MLIAVAIIAGCGYVLVHASSRFFLELKGRHDCAQDYRLTY
jgi:hypothetical protein